MASVLMFPIPFPDETITSVVTRYHQISGGIGVRRTLLDLFGVVTKSYASELPCYLTHLEAVSGCTDLAENHTLLPYFEPFLSTEKAKRAREMMQSSHPVGLKLELGITAAGFEKYRTRRYCPRCVALDFVVCGVSYWHVGHQAAGVHVCSRHHCYLHHVRAKLTMGDFNQFFLPSDIIGHEEGHAMHPQSDAYFCRLAELADIIDWGRCNRQSIARLLEDDYLHFVINRAGLISKGRICAKKLEEHFIRSSSDYPSDYEFQRLFALRHGRIVWPLDLLRLRKSSHHPILFYTFLNCLGIDLECLIEDCSKREKYKSPDKPRIAVASMESSNLEKTLRRKSFLAAYAETPAKKTRDYMWLYRHDKKWLRSHISGNRKTPVVQDLIDWKKRDSELAENVTSAVSKIAVIPGPPVQISLASICRFLSLPNDTFRNRSKLPKSIYAIQASVESRHDYQIRKLAWAARSLDAENIKPTKSNLLRRSNIRLCCLTEKEISRFVC